MVENRRATAHSLDRGDGHYTGRCGTLYLVYASHELRPVDYPIAFQVPPRQQGDMVSVHLCNAPSMIEEIVTGS